SRVKAHRFARKSLPIVATIGRKNSSRNGACSVLLTYRWLASAPKNRRVGSPAASEGRCALEKGLHVLRWLGTRDGANYKAAALWRRGFTSSAGWEPETG